MVHVHRQSKRQNCRLLITADGRAHAVPQDMSLEAALLRAGERRNA